MTEALDAARKLLVSEGFHQLSLEAVAKEAGITRMTLYNRYGSKAGLLEALLDETARRGDAVRMREAAELSDPRRALERFLEECCRFWSSNRALFRRLVALAEVDPLYGKAIEKREAQRHANAERLARRLPLAKGVTRAEAARTLTLLSSFSAYDALAGKDDRAREDAQRALERLAAAVFAS